MKEEINVDKCELVGDVLRKYFVLRLFEEQNRAFSMGIIINAGCINFQDLSPEYFF